MKKFLLLISLFVNLYGNVNAPNFSRMCMPEEKFQKNLIEFKENECIWESQSNDIIPRIDIIIYNPDINCYLVKKNGFISGEQYKGESQLDAAKRIIKNEVGVDITPLKIIDSYQQIFEHPIDMLQNQQDLIHISSNVVYINFCEYIDWEYFKDMEWLNIYEKPKITNDFYQLIFDHVHAVMINYLPVSMY